MPPVAIGGTSLTQAGSPPGSKHDDELWPGRLSVFLRRGRDDGAHRRPWAWRCRSRLVRVAFVEESEAQNDQDPYGRPAHEAIESFDALLEPLDGIKYR